MMGYNFLNPGKDPIFKITFKIIRYRPDCYKLLHDLYWVFKGFFVQFLMRVVYFDGNCYPQMG